MSSALVIVGPRALNVQLLEALDSGRPHIDVEAQRFQRLPLGCAEIAGVGPNLCDLCISRHKRVYIYISVLDDTRVPVPKSHDMICVVVCIYIICII